MFFIRNIFILFYLGFKKNNFSQLNFKKKYKLYLFFSKYNSYFSRFFSLFNLKNLTPFYYFFFFNFIIKKNFNHDKFKTIWYWVSNENLLFILFFFLNKTFKIKVSTKFKKISKVKQLLNNTLVFNNQSLLKYTLLLNNTKKNLNSTKLNLSNALKNNKFIVNYSGTSLGKYINNISLENMTFYFLRKTKMFNKGRYSRNRQNYRTGVYWCLYINIMVLFGLYYYFYRFTLNFGYLWWLFFALIASFFVPRIIKYRLYNIKVLLTTISNSLPLIFFLLP